MSTAALFCRSCGKQLSEEEQKPGNVYCTGCKPAEPEAATAAASAGQAYAPPVYAPPQPGAPSPGLAFLLGLIPGVGAIYNGQYAKGLLHVFILGLLASIAGSIRGSGEALFAMMIIAFVAYMAFEAYHTARRRLMGEPVDEFSSLFQWRASSLVAPVALIVVGVVFLLENLGVLRFEEIARFWPVLLIVIGVYLLYQRLAGDSHSPSGGGN